MAALSCSSVIRWRSSRIAPSAACRAGVGGAGRLAATGAGAGLRGDEDVSKARAMGIRERTGNWAAMQWRTPEVIARQRLAAGVVDCERVACCATVLIRR